MKTYFDPDETSVSVGDVVATDQMPCDSGEDTMTIVVLRDETKVTPDPPEPATDYQHVSEEIFRRVLGGWKRIR
jgi:hypothetical protein